MGCDGKTRSATVASPTVAPAENRAGPPRKHFKAEDWGLVCDWQQIRGNLEALEGSEGRTQIGFKAPTKMKSFQAMAIYINDRQSRGSNLKTLDGPGARNRFMYIHSKYKKAKIDVNSTGFGLTKADEVAGVTTIEQKLHVVCPCYGRMDQIFGDSPAVNVCQNLAMGGLDGDNSDTMPSSSAASTFILSDDEDGKDSEDGVPPTGCVIPDNIPAHEQGTFAPPRVFLYVSIPEISTLHERAPPTPQSFTTEATSAKVKHQKKTFDYLNRKAISENRHSMNGAFAATLDSFAEEKAKSNNIKAELVVFRREKHKDSKQLQVDQDERERSERGVARKLEVSRLKQARDLEEARMNNQQKQFELKMDHQKQKVDDQHDKAKMRMRLSIIQDYSKIDRSKEDIVDMIKLLEGA